MEEKKVENKEEEKNKKKMTILVINIIAIVVILSVVGYVVFANDQKSEAPEGQLGKMGQTQDMEIEEICENFGDQEAGQGQRPENFNGTPPEGTEPPENRGNGEAPEGIQERRALMQEICEDGEVTDEEKQKWEELEN